ncbi:CxC2 domain-containing protein [Mycena indigotica]|uniref:CxC2 domain-containing protein n=1 Tax=Mycena indigotica TaxID=2126181 RepID=A0A8H6RXX8_9AGAR|nr:CxC2 domain-containing protein [Mycena indigotica]KAF7289354.1 CxC2 domain-containing protein [Mycena indigotica]
MPGNTKRIMSWIWTAPGAFDDEEEQLHTTMRVEWCRAMARKTRWNEEVMLLEEEMRRTLRYLQWQMVLRAYAARSAAAKRAGAHTFSTEMGSELEE